MSTVVLDLEFTSVNDSKKRRICKDEIIQIGAVKIDDSNTITDRFESLVKPKYSEINKKVFRLTGITQDMLIDAPEFDDVFYSFLNWIGDEDFTIMSWSETDLKVIISECNLNGFFDQRIEKLLFNWVDLQQTVGQILGISQQLALEKVLAAGNIKYEGKQHTALDDAENTAQIYYLTKDESRLQSVLGPIIELFAPKEELSFTMGSLFSGFVCKTA